MSKQEREDQVSENNENQEETVIDNTGNFPELKITVN